MVKARRVDNSETEDDLRYVRTKNAAVAKHAKRKQLSLSSKVTSLQDKVNTLERERDFERHRADALSRELHRLRNSYTQTVSGQLLDLRSVKPPSFIKLSPEQSANSAHFVISSQMSTPDTSPVNSAVTSRPVMSPVRLIHVTCINYNAVEEALSFN